MAEAAAKFAVEEAKRWVHEAEVAAAKQRHDEVRPCRLQRGPRVLQGGADMQAGAAGGLGGGGARGTSCTFSINAASVSESDGSTITSSPSIGGGVCDPPWIAVSASSWA